MAEAVRLVVRGTGELLITAGLVLLLFCVYELQVTGLYTGRQQQALAADLREQWDERPVRVVQPVPRPGASPAGPRPSAAPAVPPVPAPAAVRPVTARRGQPVAVLHVPRLGDDPQVVVEGVSVADLKRGPGHYPGTAAPGAVGNVVLAGHRTTYGAPFAELGDLQRGDALVLETADGWFTYRTTERRIVPPTAVEEVLPVPGRRDARPVRKLLTLVTCHPRYSARQRMVVRAELEQALAKGPGVRPPALSGARGA